MKENLKKFTDFVPAGIPLIYIIGFIVVNGQLSNFNFSDYSVLNFSYLKAGLLFSFLVTLYFLTVYYSFWKDTMTDNLEKAWPSYLLMLSNVLFVTLLIGLLLVNIKALVTGNSTKIHFILGGVATYVFFRIWSFNKRPKNNRGVLLLTVPPTIILIAVLILLATENEMFGWFVLFTCGISIMFSISLGVYGDKDYNTRMITDVILLLMACFFFGKQIYSKFPAKFGGGEELRIGILHYENVGDVINKPHRIDTVSILYQNNEEFLIRDNRSKLLFINKSKIGLYEVLRSE